MEKQEEKCPDCGCNPCECPVEEVSCGCSCCRC
jgi:hypothetical protein